MLRLLCFCCLICCMSFAACGTCLALDLSRVKVNFLSGDYKAAIKEGEKLLATEGEASHSDALYYLMGLSYLKDGNYLRASDIFEIILKEFRDSPFTGKARMGLGDTEFLRGNYQGARNLYRKLLDSRPAQELLPALYYRLAQCAIREGDTERAKEYLARLKQDFPASAESVLSGELSARDFYYTVQVGSFASGNNARRLVHTLTQKGYPAYLEEADAAGGRTYRVRIGKLSSRQEAQELQQQLSREGYPTKIFP